MSNLNAEPLVAVKLDPSCASDPFSSAVLNAYAHAEEMRAFNRLFAKRLAVLAAAWLLAGRVLFCLSWPVLLLGCAMFAAAGLWASLAEHRATMALRSLLER